MTTNNGTGIISGTEYINGVASLNGAGYPNGVAYLNGIENIDDPNSERWKVDRAPTDDADIILVGGGKASSRVMPLLCRALEGKVRGCVFIDHDPDEISRFQQKMEHMKVPSRPVHLQRSTSQRDEPAFTEQVQKFHMKKDRVRWDMDIADRPAMIRLHVWMNRETIFNAVQLYLRAMRGIRAKIVFVFGMTGMTSATVALEAATWLRWNTLDWLFPYGDNNSPIDILVPVPEQIGISLVAPDVRDGSNDWNLQHGRSVAEVIERKMENNDLVIEDQALVDTDGVDKSNPLRREIFEIYGCLDASVNPYGHMSMRDFENLASNALATIFTGKAPDTGNPTWDAREILNDFKEHPNFSLVMAGVPPEAREEVEIIRKKDNDVRGVQRTIEEVHGKIQNIQKKIADHINLNESEEEASQGGEGAEDRRENRRASNKETLEDVKGDIDRLSESYQGVLNVAGNHYKEGLNTQVKAVEDARQDIMKREEDNSQTEQEKSSPTRTKTFLTYFIWGVIVPGALAGAIGVYLGDPGAGLIVFAMFALLMFGATWIYRKFAATGSDGEAQALRDLVNALNKLNDLSSALRDLSQELEDAVNGDIRNLDDTWKKMKYSNQWVMPNAESWIRHLKDKALPLSADDGPGNTALNDKRAAERDRMSNSLYDVLLDTVSPLVRGKGTMQAEKLKLRVAGPKNASEDLQIRELPQSFETNLEIKTNWMNGGVLPNGRVISNDSEQGTEDLCHFIQMWKYKEEPYLPQYYKIGSSKNVDSESLPDECDAWPKSSTSVKENLAVPAGAGN